MKLEKEGILAQILRKNDCVQDFLGVKIYTKLSRKEWENLKKHIDQKVKLTLEMQEPILDEAERKYLSGVIRPFRDKIEYIKKLNEHYFGDEYILIKTDSNLTPLPYFKKGTMYKNMELNKEYTLDDLNL